MRQTQPHEPLDLAEALRIIQRLHVAIIQTPRSVKLWASGARISKAVRLTIRKHRAEVRALIAKSDIAICSDPYWHRRFWSHLGNQCYRCDKCDQLRPWINSDATGGKKRKHNGVTTREERQ